MYVEYQTKAGGAWYPCKYCKNCMVDNFLNKQFGAYLENLKTISCPKALENMLNEGPPQFIRDAPSFPGDGTVEPKGQLHALWFASDRTTVSARLTGAPEGEERQLLWDRLVAETMPRVLQLQADIAASGKATKDDE